jgi:hypothetical protein
MVGIPSSLTLSLIVLHPGDGPKRQVSVLRQPAKMSSKAGPLADNPHLVLPPKPDGPKTASVFKSVRLKPKIAAHVSELCQQLKTSMWFDEKANNREKSASSRVSMNHSFAASNSELSEPTEAFSSLSPADQDRLIIQMSRSIAELRKKTKEIELTPHVGSEKKLGAQK